MYKWSELFEAWHQIFYRITTFEVMKMKMAMAGRSVDPWCYATSIGHISGSPEKFQLLILFAFDDFDEQILISCQEVLT